MTDVTEMPERKRRRPKLYAIPAVVDNSIEGRVAKRLRMPRISRDLTKAGSWLRELGSIYRLARRGVLEPETASRLAFICSNAGKLASSLEELDKLEDIRKQLEQHNRALGNGAWVEPGIALDAQMTSTSPEGGTQ